MNAPELSLFGDPDQPTAAELREEARKKAAPCPCCGGSTMTYRRKLNSGMARTLCWLILRNPDTWVTAADMPDDVRRFATELGKLELWGLVESRTNPDGEKFQESTQWKWTLEGEAFAEELLRVPSHIFLASPGNRVRGFETTLVGIREALGDHFDYDELMEGTRAPQI